MLPGAETLSFFLLVPLQLCCIQVTLNVANSCSENNRVIVELPHTPATVSIWIVNWGEVS
jgi:hypothetical protein